MTGRCRSGHRVGLRDRRCHLHRRATRRAGLPTTRRCLHRRAGPPEDPPAIRRRRHRAGLREDLPATPLLRRRADPRGPLGRPPRVPQPGPRERRSAPPARSPVPRELDPLLGGRQALLPVVAPDGGAYQRQHQHDRYHDGRYRPPLIARGSRHGRAAYRHTGATSAGSVATRCWWSGTTCWVGFTIYVVLPSLGGGDT